MSAITKDFRKKSVNFDAVERIRQWLLNTIDQEDLGIPVRVNNLARKTRKVAIITERNNQPYFENYVLQALEKEGICKINKLAKEVTFVKIPEKNKNASSEF
jgi:hypothetical protein